jgi:hypothetical protein
MNHRLRLSRRGVLGGISAASALLAVPVLRAQVEGPPARLVVIYHPNGVVWDQWHVKQAEASFELSPLLNAFADLKEDMIVTRGIHLEFKGGGEHRGGITQNMSGFAWSNEKLEGGTATARSIDQILASESPLLRGTAVPSVQLGGDNRLERDGELASMSMSWNAPFAPLPAEVDVVKAYANLFGQLGNAGSKAGMERLLAREQSVLDFLQADLASLRARVPNEEFAKLDAHLETIRQFERTLRAQSQAGEACAGVAAPEPGGLAPNVDENYARIVDAQLKLISTTLSCDVSRVVTMMMAGSTSRLSLVKGGHLPLKAGGGLHQITHGTALTDGDWLQVITWYYKKIASFLLELKNTAEGNGSLLDRTLVVVLSEVGQDHHTEDLPILVFGGKALGLKLGQSLFFDDRRTNDFWRTVAEVFQVSGEGFGDPEIGTGRLSELLG